jgi:hypothetical protein
VVERLPLNREVRGSNPSHDTMALLLGRHYEFPQCGIIKEKLLLLIYYYYVFSGSSKRLMLWSLTGWHALRRVFCNAGRLSVGCEDCIFILLAAVRSPGSDWVS